MKDYEVPGMKQHRRILLFIVPLLLFGISIIMTVLGGMFFGLPWYFATPLMISSIVVIALALEIRHSSNEAFRELEASHRDLYGYACKFEREKDYLPISKGDVMQNDSDPANPTSDVMESPHHLNS